MTKAKSTAAPAPEADKSAPAPAVAAEAGSAAPPPADSPETTEPGQKPAAAPETEGSEGADPTDALKAAMTAYIDAGFEAIKAEFGEKMGELAEHCEKRIDTLAEAVAAADMAKIEVLVQDAQEAVNVLKTSGAADLDTRLTKLEMQLRHSL